jgi:hypothetical protein
VFNNVEVDLSEPPVVFKAQLFALTNVPVERQKSSCLCNPLPSLRIK